MPPNIREDVAPEARSSESKEECRIGEASMALGLKLEDLEQDLASARASWLRQLLRNPYPTREVAHGDSTARPVGRCRTSGRGAHCRSESFGDSLIWPSLKGGDMDVLTVGGSVWILGSLAVGVAAEFRGRMAPPWFLISMVLSPLLGAWLLTAMPQKNQRNGFKLNGGSGAENSATYTRCLECRKMVQRDAGNCEHCGSALVSQ